MAKALRLHKEQHPAIELDTILISYHSYKPEALKVLLMSAMLFLKTCSSDSLVCDFPLQNQEDGQKLIGHFIFPFPVCLKDYDPRRALQ